MIRISVFILGYFLFGSACFGQLGGDNVFDEFLPPRFEINSEQEFRNIDFNKAKETNVLLIKSNGVAKKVKEALQGSHGDIGFKIVQTDTSDISEILKSDVIGALLGYSIGSRLGSTFIINPLLAARYVTYKGMTLSTLGYHGIGLAVSIYGAVQGVRLWHKFFTPQKKMLFEVKVSKSELNELTEYFSS